MNSIPVMELHSSTESQIKTTQTHLSLLWGRLWRHCARKPNPDG